MIKKDLHFLRLDANQAAVIIGLFETLSIVSLYFTVGAVIGALVLGVKIAGHEFGNVNEMLESYEQNSDADSQAYAIMGVLFLVFLIPLIFPLLLLIGAVKGNRCMMLPWMIVGWMRAIVGIFVFFVVFAFPMGSCAQFFFFVSQGIYYAMTVYSLNAVCCSYTHMRLIESQNHALIEAEKLPYNNF